MSSAAPSAAQSLRLFGSFRFRPYAQLVRLPNVFTALADICLGTLATRGLPEHWLAFVFLLLASACLYCGGMVWNDYFDLEQDRRERPFRPLPSGRVTRRAAVRLGVLLLGAGVGFAFLSGWRSDGWTWTPLVLAVLLVVAILLYDGWLKHTASGPVGMGLCRFLNVLLGLSVAGGELPDWGFHMAAAVGVYIVGVTWFARTEARTSKQSSLMAAAGVMLAGLLTALADRPGSPPAPARCCFLTCSCCSAFWWAYRFARRLHTRRAALVQTSCQAGHHGVGTARRGVGHGGRRDARPANSRPVAAGALPGWWIYST